MALPVYQLRVNGNDLSNVQQFTFTVGRTKVSDPLRAGTGTIRGRVPSALPAIAIGDDVVINIYPGGISTGSSSFRFRVADFRVFYGYTAALDEWELDIEDVFANFGRTVFSSSWTAGSSTFTAISTVATNCGATAQSTAVPTLSKVSAQVIINENGLEVLSALANTEQCRLQVEPLANNTLNVFGRGWQTQVVTFDVSDDGTGTAPIKYDGLDFDGLADNYADKVIINPAGLAQQSAGVGNYSLELPSYNQTTGDAASLASYLLGVFNEQEDKPAVLETKASLQDTTQAQTNLGTMCNPLSQAKIKFRGTIYYGIIEGFTITGYPDDVLFTYYLSSPDFFPIFILNSAQFGVLDQNKLGY